MIGLDTGFFVKLLEGHPDCVQTWTRIIEGDETAVVSCLTLFELARLALKGVVEKASVALLEQAIPGTCELVWIDNSNLLTLGANLSHGLGIPAIDALILAGFVRREASTIYTTDPDFSRYQKKGVRVVYLASSG